MGKGAPWGNNAGLGRQPRGHTDRDTQTHLDTQSQTLGNRDTWIQKHTHRYRHTIAPGHTGILGYTDMDPQSGQTRDQEDTHRQIKIHMEQTQTHNQGRRVVDAQRHRHTVTDTANKPGHTDTVTRTENQIKIRDMPVHRHSQTHTDRYPPRATHK